MGMRIAIPKVLLLLLFASSLFYAFQILISIQTYMAEIDAFHFFIQMKSLFYYFPLFFLFLYKITYLQWKIKIPKFHN